MTDDELDLVAREYKLRRESLGITVVGAAKKAAMSATTWLHIEKAREVRSSSYVRAAAVLDWPSDAKDRILAGEPLRQVSPDIANGGELATIEHLLESALTLLRQVKRP